MLGKQDCVHPKTSFPVSAYYILEGPSFILLVTGSISLETSLQTLSFYIHFVYIVLTVLLFIVSNLSITTMFLVT